MKQFALLLVVIIFITTQTFAQTGNVGIGTTSPAASAKLHIEGNGNKGVLLPKAALTSTRDVTTVPNVVKGLMVYNTNTQNDVEADHHYWWDGEKWTRAITAEKVGTIEPPTINWDNSAGAPFAFTDIPTNQYQVMGPYYVSNSGWYSAHIRTYFLGVYTTTPAPAAPLPTVVVTYSINDNNRTGSFATDDGQLFDSRFYAHQMEANPQSAPYMYLKAGQAYYVKYIIRPITPNTKGQISTEKRIVLKQFK